MWIIPHIAILSPAAAWQRVRQWFLPRFCQSLEPADAAEVVALLAARLGIDALVASGEWGTIQSAPLDKAVFAVYARTGTWAPTTNRLFIEFFKARGGGMYLDIGANIGLTTIPVARNPEVACVAFEPDPINFRNLTANVAANCPHGNVTLRPLAVYAHRCTLAFELSDRNLGDHRIRPDHTSGSGQGRRETRVEAAPLDELIGGIPGPLAVKCDTQGAEPFVVSGGSRVLSRADLVVLEFWPYGMAMLGADPETVFSFIAPFPRVRILSKEHKGNELPPPIDRPIDALRAFMRQHRANSRMYVDLVAERNVSQGGS